jgi:hypothetical protein
MLTEILKLKESLTAESIHIALIHNTIEIHVAKVHKNQLHTKTISFVTDDLRDIKGASQNDYIINAFNDFIIR